VDKGAADRGSLQWTAVNVQGFVVCGSSPIASFLDYAASIVIVFKNIASIRYPELEVPKLARIVQEHSKLVSSLL
jgi:hypothetical protein